MSFYQIIVHATPKPGDVNCPVHSALGMLSEMLDVDIDEVTGVFEKPSELDPSKIESCEAQCLSVLKVKIEIKALDR